MQTILGANGVIGVELAKSLAQYTDKIRLVSRNPRRVNPGDETFAADLMDAEATLRAVAGSTVVYLTAGFPYSLSVWRAAWPVVMRNVIDACKKHQSRLVFFDNVYLYGRVQGWMTEETPVQPTSRKGEVRAEIAEMLMSEVRRGGLTALIARSADFYGPRTPTGVVNLLVFENLKKGKKAQWLMNDRVKHSFTYTPDAGRATAMLGNSDKAFNQFWHLPTDKNALTGRQFVEAAAREFGVEPRCRVLKKGTLKLVGLFNAVVRESIEMLYQNDSDYLFDSGKFDKAFDFKTTPYEQGIKETVRSMS
jgi:nucleoside-diphosphate-sugar epimerase